MSFSAQTGVPFYIANHLNLFLDVCT